MNVSAANAFRPLTHLPEYAPVKAGVSNITQRLAAHIAQEYSPRIRVTVIVP